jgi:hypothetical protein
MRCGAAEIKVAWRMNSHARHEPDFPCGDKRLAKRRCMWKLLGI